MSDVTNLSYSIAATTIGTAISCHGETIPLLAVANLYQTISTHGSSPLHASVQAALLRLTETHVLSHPKLSRLVVLWDSIVGTAKERIASNLRDILASDPDDLFVEHVYRCLSGSAARRGRATGEHQFQFEAILERESQDPANAGRELRCNCCGYHFRPRDIPKDKVRTILDIGLTLANSLFPGRNEDAFKPTQTRNGEPTTRLTIDHVMPEETLGWSEADNLAIMCQFCNQGKLAYFRPLEPLSIFAIGGLANSPPDRTWNSLKAQIVVSALRSQGGTCSGCGVARREAELTVRPLESISDGFLCGFAPWNLRTACYNCASERFTAQNDPISDFASERR